MRIRYIFCLWALLIIYPSDNLNAQTDPGSSSRDLRTAEDFYNDGQFDEAAKLFLEAAGRKGKRIIAYYNAARSYHQDYMQNNELDSLKAAVEGYYRVLDLNPEHHETLINLELARVELEKVQNPPESEKKGEDSAPDDQQDKNGNSGQDGQRDGDSGENPEQSAQDNLEDLAQEQQDLAESPADGHNSEKQSELKNRTEQARDEADNDTAARDILDEAVQKQQDAMDQMSRGNSDEAKKAQQEAASLLQEAVQRSAEAESQKGAESLPEDIQSILNQEQSRNQDKNDEEDMIRVEKNW